MKELRDEDVRALNERALTEHEKQEREQRTAAGRRTSDDSREGVVVNGALSEGRRTLSWIWFTTSDDDNSPAMHEGLFFFMRVILQTMLIICGNSSSCRMGKM